MAVADNALEHAERAAGDMNESTLWGAFQENAGRPDSAVEGSAAEPTWDTGVPDTTGGAWVESVGTADPEVSFGDDNDAFGAAFGGDPLQDDAGFDDAFAPPARGDTPVVAGDGLGVDGAHAAPEVIPSSGPEHDAIDALAVTDAAHTVASNDGGEAKKKKGKKKKKKKKKKKQKKKENEIGVGVGAGPSAQAAEHKDETLQAQPGNDAESVAAEMDVLQTDGNQSDNSGDIVARASKSSNHQSPAAAKPPGPRSAPTPPRGWELDPKQRSAYEKYFNQLAKSQALRTSRAVAFFLKSQVQRGDLGRLLRLVGVDIDAQDGTFPFTASNI